MRCDRTGGLQVRPFVEGRPRSRESRVQGRPSMAGWQRRCRWRSPSRVGSRAVPVADEATGQRRAISRTATHRADIPFGSMAPPTDLARNVNGRHPARMRRIPLRSRSSEGEGLAWDNASRRVLPPRYALIRDDGASDTVGAEPAGCDSDRARTRGTGLRGRRSGKRNGPALCWPVRWRVGSG